MDFYQIQTLSAYDFGKSSVKIPSYIDKGLRYGYKGLGICEENTVYAFPSFAERMQKEENAVPFYGMILSLEENGLSLEGEVLVLNEDGYSSLMGLLSLQKKVYTFSDLASFSKGLAFVLKSESPSMKEEEHLSRIRPLVESLKEIFRGRLFGGTEIYSKEDSASISVFRSFLKEEGIVPIAFPKVIYLDKEDGYEAYRMLEAIHLYSSSKTVLTGEDLEKGGPFFLLSPKAVLTVYGEEEVKNQEILAKMVSFTLLKKRGMVLRAKGVDAPKEIRSLALGGLKKRVGDPLPPKYLERLNYELSTISEMDFSDYFLIVRDYVVWAKEHGVKVGPGRGSACGSLTTYALGITEIDPLKYGLSFERFLNPLRRTMPDIDMDFEDDKRNSVVEYLVSRYGKDRVSFIVTFTGIKLKSALNRVADIFGIPAGRLSPLSKALSDKAVSFEDEEKTNPKFRKLLADPYYREAVRRASLIVSYPTTTSVHASGVLISERPLSEQLPVRDGDIPITLYEYNALETMGYLKFDILALSNLTFIKNVEENIRALGYEYSDPYQHLNDPKVFETLNRLRVLDIFQLESSGIQNAVEQIRPSSISDLSAILALYRPGPMRNITTYADRKNRHYPYKLECAELEDILKETYGIIVYQEQILEIAKRIGGFSGGEADLFRRAISKKDRSKMDSMKERFLQGAEKNGLSPDSALKIYDLIERFASYGFNKSHSYAYAFVVYTMLYYKTYYPAAFYLESLNRLSLGSDKGRNFLGEIYASSLSLSLPDINVSEEKPVFRNGKFILGFSEISGLSSPLSKAILDERKKNGPFRSLGDFFIRLDLRSYKASEFAPLVEAGAFDRFPYPRSALISMLDSLMSVHLMGVNSEDELPYMEKGTNKKDLEMFLEELGTLGVSLSVKLEDLIEGARRYPELYLVLDSPRGAGTVKAVPVADRFGKKTLFYSVPVALEKYDIISVKTDVNGRYRDVAAVYKERKKENV